MPYEASTQKHVNFKSNEDLLTSMHCDPGLGCLDLFFFPIQVLLQKFYSAS